MTFRLPILITLVATAWITTLVASYVLLPSWEIRGQFGDLFGAVNALFSGLAFAGLIYTIQLQTRELDLQRQELQLQREEMRASRLEQAKAASAQEELVAKQVVSARINGLSAIVQGRYQYANSFGVNASLYAKDAFRAEETLIQLLHESGLDIKTIERRH
jgi:hypothetical protein